MSLRSDLRDLVAGDAEPLRWRLARALLRLAGGLVAKSPRDTLNAQTAKDLGFLLAPWGNEVTLVLRGSWAPLDEYGDYSGRAVIDRNNAHGLLVQLAAACYEADRHAAATEASHG